MVETAIKIDVETEFLEQHSSPSERRFVFAYTITISNNGDEDVQLLSRHWIITDGNNNVQEVTGDGVVGEKPFIPVGKSYRYTSGAVLETAIGTMEGSYQMISASGTPFDASIETFSLADPSALH